ncbi:Biotin and thiamin synthesis associated [Elusimicrobium minutum Pei191]|uniref:Biotin and thiamin synthesis associated n=1 Tax=Elusimicrobium minutum (strain Pei191) TaxID=445932 RepID=B2KED7_ELUMP|nr:[FeFe] hydrogenase H-cluster radical SAM maturase HydG [Elusimicrobium minutum]ACC98883.1 Biotin and thiamin synthesis associated [Elusimicrobium minutum Pei191]
MIINDAELSELIKNSKAPTEKELNKILLKAKKLNGLNKDEVLSLLNVEDEKQLEQIYSTAKFIKEEIYGNRMVLFAPLYISNLCSNECLYCAFRVSNKSLVRRALPQEEIEKEVIELLKQGHKRILLVAGESYPGGGLKYIFDSIDTVYKTKWNGQNIRRVNVNIAPLTEEEFKELSKHNIGTFQLFQETYHKPTYSGLHIAGQKKNFEFRLNAMDRALKNGIHDVGIGILFGLYDYKFEVMAMLEHISHLEKTYGIGPHTISVPRIEPADGSDLSLKPPYQLSDLEFKKVLAILRIAVPYTGIILSTRENSQMRTAAIEMGVSQMSAGSKTNPGGYEEGSAGAQFSLGDHRTLEQVILDLVKHNHVPSFCTGCYRLGRVGKDFMDLAKPGLIKHHCLPNAIFTFAEYLHDFAGEELKQKGFALIEKTVNEEIKDENLKKLALKNLHDIKNGKRDIYL